MNRIYLISFILFFMVSCSIKESKTDLGLSSYCNNELNLLNSFDTIPTLRGDFQFIMDSLDQKLSMLFKDDNYCKYLRFNIIHLADSSESIKLSLKYFYQCDNCPHFHVERNVCVILLNSYGQILFENRIINIDSLDNEIVDYYSNVGKDYYFPDTYDRVYLALQWDLDVSKNNFSKFINQIILGYLSSVNENSKTKFNKEICQLNLKELSRLSKLIPLNIELPIFEIIEIEDELEL